MAQPPPYRKPFAIVQALFRKFLLRIALERVTAAAEERHLSQNTLTAYRRTWLKLIAWTAAEGLALETLPSDRADVLWVLTGFFVRVIGEHKKVGASAPSEERANSCQTPRR